MGKEQTLSGVQCFDCLHFLISQSKVEYIDIFKNTIFPLCKWPPARNLGMVFGQIFPGGLLLLEYVGLYLVDSRFDFCKMGKVKISIRVEIGNADGT